MSLSSFVFCKQACNSLAYIFDDSMNPSHLWVKPLQTLWQIKSLVLKRDQQLCNISSFFPVQKLWAMSLLLGVGQQRTSLQVTPNLVREHFVWVGGQQPQVSFGFPLMMWNFCCTHQGQKEQDPSVFSAVMPKVELSSHECGPGGRKHSQAHCCTFPEFKLKNK